MAHKLLACYASSMSSQTLNIYDAQIRNSEVVQVKKMNLLGYLEAKILTSSAFAMCLNVRKGKEEKGQERKKVKKSESATF